MYDTFKDIDSFNLTKEQKEAIINRDYTKASSLGVSLFDFLYIIYSTYKYQCNTYI